jgi:hypothetical protein
MFGLRNDVKFEQNQDDKKFHCVTSNFRAPFRIISNYIFSPNIQFPPGSIVMLQRLCDSKATSDFNIDCICPEKFILREANYAKKKLNKGKIKTGRG